VSQSPEICPKRLDQGDSTSERAKKKKGGLVGEDGVGIPWEMGCGRPCSKQKLNKDTVNLPSAKGAFLNQVWGEGADAVRGENWKRAAEGKDGGGPCKAEKGKKKTSLFGEKGGVRGGKKGRKKGPKSWRGIKGIPMRRERPTPRFGGKKKNLHR